MSAKEHLRLQLSAYLDGQLTAPEAQRVTVALEGDGELRQELAELANVRTLLRGLPRERASEDLIPCVLAEAERTQLVGAAADDELAGGMRWVRRLASAAVLLLAATIGVVTAITLWSPPQPNYAVSLGRRSGGTVIAPAGGPASSATPARSAGESGRYTDSAAPADGTAGDTSTVDALAMLMKNGRAINGTGAGETEMRDPTALHAELRTTETQREETRDVEGLARLAKARGVTEGKVGPDAVAETGGGAGGGAGPGAGKDDRPAARGKGFAKDYAAIDSALAVGGDSSNEVIFTDRMDETNRQIEKVLLANGIAPVTVKESTVAPKKGLAPRGNFYSQNRLAAGQVQYEVFVTPEQMSRVQEDLHGLRAKQNVSQDIALRAADGAESSHRRAGASSIDKRLGEPAADKYAVEPKAEEKAKSPATKAAGAAEAIQVAATAEPVKAPVAPDAAAAPAPALTPAPKPAAAGPAPAGAPAPATAPPTSVKSELRGDQWAEDLAKREQTGDRFKEAGDKEQAGEPAKKPSAKLGQTGAGTGLGDLADNKPGEHPEAKPTAGAMVMAKPTTTAAPEPTTPPTAARASSHPAKVLPGRTDTGGTLGLDDSARKAEQPASRPGEYAYEQRKLVANAPLEHEGDGAKHKAGWTGLMDEEVRAAGRPRAPQAPAPATTTPHPPATAPAQVQMESEAIVEVKVLSGHDAPATTQPAQTQAQTVVAAEQAGPAVQLVTQQKLDEDRQTTGQAKVQGDNTQRTLSETQANQAGQAAQPGPGQGALADQSGQGQQVQQPPAGQARQMYRFGHPSQQLRQTASQNATARVQRLLITVNLRGDQDSTDNRAKAAAKTQAQQERPAPKD